MICTRSHPRHHRSPCSMDSRTHHTHRTPRTSGPDRVRIPLYSRWIPRGDRHIHADQALDDVSSDPR